MHSAQPPLLKPFPDAPDATMTPQENHSVRFRALLNAQAGDGQAGSDMVGAPRKIRKGATLYRMGDAFKSLAFIHYGQFKRVSCDTTGHEQVTGFAMSGDLLGVEGIGLGTYTADSIALENSLICEIAYTRLEAALACNPALLHCFNKLLSRIVNDDRQALISLAFQNVDQRFARFLLDMSSAYAARGGPPTDVFLKMKREDIANYLGMTRETLSRVLTKFQKQGLLTIADHRFHLSDLLRLQEIAEGSSQRHHPDNR